MGDDRIDDLSDAELRVRLLQRGVHAGIVTGLVADRDTAGGEWRIRQELG